MSGIPSPCGVWRFTLRRLGAGSGPWGERDVLVAIVAGGTVTLSAWGHPTEPGLGFWRSAGPGRVVMAADWAARTPSVRATGRLWVRAAAEFAVDGLSCQARLQWRYANRAGQPSRAAVTAEASGTRLRG